MVSTEQQFLSHLCPIGLGAGGLIDPSWCFAKYGEVLSALPPIRKMSDIEAPELVLYRDARLRVCYCPFDQINPAARVMIIGVTPGAQQMYLACRAAQDAVLAGVEPEAVLATARQAAAFGGTMRVNLITMLDQIGLQDALDLGTSAQLFADRAHLLQSTSAVLHPVFLNGRNYSGHPDPQSFPLLDAFINQVLRAEIDAVPDALIIPLGRVAEAAVKRLELVDRYVVYGFPHPSGANGYRLRQFNENQSDMAMRIRAWKRMHRW